MTNQATPRTDVDVVLKFVHYPKPFLHTERNYPTKSRGPAPVYSVEVVMFSVYPKMEPNPQYPDGEDFQIGIMHARGYKLKKDGTPGAVAQGVRVDWPDLPEESKAQIREALANVLGNTRPDWVEPEN